MIPEEVAKLREQYNDMQKELDLAYKLIQDLALLVKDVAESQPGIHLSLIKNANRIHRRASDKL